MTFVLSEASSLVAPVRSAGPVLGRKFLVDVVREPPQLVLLGRQDGLIAQLRLAGCQQLLQVRLDPPSAQPADEEVRQLHRRRRSEEHTSELQSLMRISYAVFCLKKKRQSSRQAEPV